MPLEYVRPASMDEALQILARHGAAARLLAGGTDLILEMQFKRPEIGCVVDISRLSELRGIRKTGRPHEGADGDEEIEIGALTPVRELETSVLLRAAAPGLVQAAGSLASVQIRNRATVGGNICHAAPSADTAPALLALGAMVEIAGPNGVESLPLERFFSGPGRTVLSPYQIVTAFKFRCPPGASSVYIKHSPRRAMDCAVVGVGAQLTLDGGRIVAARIALGAVAPTPIRAYHAEEMLLLCGAPDHDALAEAARIAAGEASPIDDIRATAGYRRRMLNVNVRRALEQALSANQGGTR